MAIKDLYRDVEKKKENEVEDDDIVTMSTEEFCDEHRNLIKVLRSGDKKMLEAEAKKQEAELAEYED
jgi:hypothetical protein